MRQSEPNKGPRGRPKLTVPKELPPLICERWMSLEVLTVKPLDSVAHARALIEEYRVNQLPVIKDRKLVGIVTDRDLRDAMNTVTTSARLARATEPVPEAPDQIAVESVMTSNLLTLQPESSLVAAAELMVRERIGSVPIVDGKLLAGIITRSDILQAFVVSAKVGGRPVKRKAKTPKQTARGTAR